MTTTKIHTTIATLAAAFAVAFAAAPAAQAAPVKDRGLPKNTDTRDGAKSEACFDLHWAYRIAYEDATIYLRGGGFAGAVARHHAAERANEALKAARRLGCRWARSAPAGPTPPEWPGSPSAFSTETSTVRKRPRSTGTGVVRVAVPEAGARKEPRETSRPPSPSNHSS